MYNVAVLAGDGIGPEIVAEAQKVLTAAGERFGFALSFHPALVGGAAYDAVGHPLPPETLATVDKCGAVLFGAVGGPQYDELPPDLRPERGALLPLRRHLQAYANLRPIRTYPALADASPLRPERLGDGIDILIIRELTGGLYFGQPKGRQDGPDGVTAVDTLVYTEAEIERILRLAFRTAQQRRGKLCSVDKENVLETSRLWRETANRLQAEYPDVELTHMLIDNATMQLILNPGQFDVIVTENTFGDIITDEGAALTGSIGLLPSASLGAAAGALYEPVHGTAPDIAGKGLANPLGQILSAAMMLRYSFGEEAAATAIEEAVASVLAEGYATGDIRRPDSKVIGTVEMGDRVAAAVLAG